MHRFAGLLWVLIALLAGCRSYVPLPEQAPVVEYKAAQRIAVSLLDSRDYLRPDQQSYVGTTIVAFGIPVSRNLGFLTGVPADDDKKLSRYLGERIVDGATKAGWDISFVDIVKLPGREEVSAILDRHGAQKLLVLDVREWFFRINLAGFNGIYSVDTFDFNHRTDLFVYAPANQAPFQLSVGADELLSLDRVKADGMRLRDFPNLFVFAFRDQLGKLLNHPDIRKQLGE